MDNNFQVNFKPTASPVNQQADIFAGINKGYSDAIGSQTKVPDLITGYDQKYGVPQLQQSIQQGTEQYDALGNQIRNLPKDMAQRSRESIMTQGQTNRAIQAEQAPLLEQQGILGQNLSRQQANLGVAQSNAAKMVSAEQVQQEKELSPWLKQYDNESILSSMRQSGWTFENQSELSRLLANQQAGITLSEGEKNRAQQLAIAEKNFQNQLELNKQQASLNPKQNYMAVGAGTSIFDPQTNSFVGTAPYKPTASGSSTYVPNFGTTTNNSSISSLWG